MLCGIVSIKKWSGTLTLAFNCQLKKKIMSTIAGKIFSVWCQSEGFQNTLKTHRKHFAKRSSECWAIKGTTERRVHAAKIKCWDECVVWLERTS